MCSEGRSGATALAFCTCTVNRKQRTHLLQDPDLPHAKRVLPKANRRQVGAEWHRRVGLDCNLRKQGSDALVLEGVQWFGPRMLLG